MTSQAYLIFIDDSEDGIDDATLGNVEKQVADKKADELFLIIESVGGSPFSAVGIMNILQARFEKISAIVPRYAKSAATLMSLGTDEIYMCERSALGPLDLPIEHPSDGSRISALDIQNTITSMATLVDSIAKARFTFLRKQGVSKSEAAGMALDNANDFLKPVVQQIDPYHLQKAQRELRIGFWYALNMLLTRMMKSQPEKARDTAKSLVNDFPAHEFSIYSHDAEFLLGLTIKKMADLPIWGTQLKEKYMKVRSKSYHIEYGSI